MTGIAARSIQGQTIHRWSGVGFAKKHDDLLVAEVCANKFATERWRKAEVLIIDESELGSSSGSKADCLLVSMMRSKLFDVLVRILSTMRVTVSPPDRNV
jgi:hypothetical protein